MNKSDLTRKDKVLFKLAYEQAYGAGWVAGYDLTSLTIGGSEGLRRERELREDGWKVSKRPKANSDAYEYRLEVPATFADYIIKRYREGNRPEIYSPYIDGTSLSLFDGGE